MLLLLFHLNTTISKIDFVNSYLNQRLRWRWRRRQRIIQKSHETISKLFRSLLMSKSTPARIILQVRRAKFRDSSAPKCGWPINCMPTIFRANENDIIRSIPVHCYWWEKRNKEREREKKQLEFQRNEEDVTACLWNYVNLHWMFAFFFG